MSVRHLLAHAEPLALQEELQAARVGEFMRAPLRRAIDRARVEGREPVEERVPVGDAVAQLDRASASGVEGLAFESRRAYH